MTTKKNNKNQLYELIFNIVLPVFLLNKLSDYSPLIALFVALSFPIGYFLFDWIKSKHVSLISILGFVNISLTGCFALYDLNSFWFAVKEASIPLLIGLGIVFTAFTNRPLVSRLLSNRNLINVDLMEEKLNDNNSSTLFNKELKTLTLYLASTFLASAILNYFVTRAIVIDIPSDIVDGARLKIRNQQIADLTWRSYLIILAPILVMFSLVMWKANTVLTKYTGLNLGEVLAKK